MENKSNQNKPRCPKCGNLDFEIIEKEPVKAIGLKEKRYYVHCFCPKCEEEFMLDKLH